MPYRKVPLTQREREVLEWVSSGKSSRDIGQILGVSHRTVEYHLQKTLKKLNACNTVHAVSRAIINGLIKPIPFWMGMAMMLRKLSDFAGTEDRVFIIDWLT